MKKIIITLAVLIGTFFAGYGVVSAQIIDPHPACPGGACWPTRTINQYNCNACMSYRDVCQGNKNITCGVSGKAECVAKGTTGPCITVCTNPGGGECQQYDEYVTCKQSGGDCQWQGILQTCQETYQSDCTGSSIIDIKGCCGPGGGNTPTPDPGPPACSCNPWTDSGACGAGGCGASQVPQTRSCNPGGCNSESRCADVSCCSYTCGGWEAVDCGEGACASDQMLYVQECIDNVTGVNVCLINSDCRPDASCVPAPDPSFCQISVPDITLTGVGDFSVVPVSIISETGGTIQQVRFDSNAAIATVCASTAGPCPAGSGTYTDLITNPLPFDAAVTAASVNPSGVYQVTATMDTGDLCSDSGAIGVDNVQAWWQTDGGDIITAGLAGVGDIISPIPINCDPAISSCQPYLILDASVGGYNVNPGVAIYQGSISVGSGGISTRNMHGRTLSVFTEGYDYQYFYDRAVALGTVFNGLNLGTIAAGGGTKTYGYSVFSGGALTVPANTTIASGAKSVVFVNGNLTINGKINFADVGTTFLMFIVRGDIIVDPAVGDTQADTASLTPDIEGIYLTDNQFFTGTNAIPDTDLQFVVRGSVLGHGNSGAVDGIVLQRSLPDNSFHPSEMFIFAPDQLLLYPNFLSPKPVRWQEIAP